MWSINLFPGLKQIRRRSGLINSASTPGGQMEPGSLVIFIPIVAIIGGISVAIAGIISNTRLREARIRERIAMIEKGLVPPPEVDPAGFDRAMVLHLHDRPGRGGPRSAMRRAGIMISSVGLGLMVLISVAGGSLRAGIGVGGFLVIVGLAFLVNSLLEPQHRNVPWPPGPPPAP
jgi:hypothetical protein